MTPDPAARLLELVRELSRRRDAGSPRARTLGEQRAYRAGFNDALNLVGSVVLELGCSEALGGERAG